jgi:hypothetical protein
LPLATVEEIEVLMPDRDSMSVAKLVLDGYHAWTRGALTPFTPSSSAAQASSSSVAAAETVPEATGMEVEENVTAEEPQPVGEPDVPVVDEDGFETVQRGRKRGGGRRH